MNRHLPNDFKDFLRFLNEEKVEYLLIGGYAVGFHGYPRATGDMDVWIALSAENARRVVKALQRFGFTHGEAEPDVFMDPGRIVRMGFPPMRIEILNKIDGVEFAEAYARHVAGSIDGVDIPVICKSDLIHNKRSTGRPKDNVDADTLEQ